MSSNSVRISKELFERARSQGGLMSRSTALQIEHWARIGEALETLGLSVNQVAEMLRARQGIEPSTYVEAVPEEELWKFKRERQAQDIENVRKGLATNEQMSWFSGEEAKAAKIKNSAL